MLTTISKKFVRTINEDQKADGDELIVHNLSDSAR